MTNKREDDEIREQSVVKMYIKELERTAMEYSGQRLR